MIRADAYALEPGDEFAGGLLKGRVVKTKAVRYYVPFPGYYAAQVFLERAGTLATDVMLVEGEAIEVVG